MFDLDDYLPYLVRRIVPRIDEAFQDQLRAVELALEEWRVLVTVYGRGSMSLGGLAEHTSINVSTLSRLVSRLHQRRLVSRVRAEGGRTVEIALMPSGRRKVELLLPLAREFEARVCSHLSPEELDEAKQILRKLYAAFAAEREWAKARPLAAPAAAE